MKKPFNLENEIWKPIPGHDGYEASNLGRIKSLEYAKPVCKGGFQYLPEKILKTRNRNGYLVVTLCKGTQKVYYVHRLVATSHIPNPNNLPEIDHIDTNRQNNCVDNLRWCTHKENNNNPITKEKQVKAHKGVRRGEMSEETKRKISAAKRGRKHSKEHLKKYLESCKWRYKPIRVYKDDIVIGDFDGLRVAEAVLGVSRTALMNSIKNKKPNRFGYLVIELENPYKRDETKI